MRRALAPALMVIPCLIFSAFSTRAQDVAMPVGIVSAGDSPFALAISEDGTQATVGNLFPELSDATNVELLDLGSQTVTRKFRLGTRLVAVTITDSRTLVVNEDKDFVIGVDLISGVELTRIGVGNRPSNVTVAGTETAMATNGTSGDLTFIDLFSHPMIEDPVFES
ncbi:MAG: hypothetical protein IIB03_00680 [Acidobacteria bacterium]|nr:hypothetical protein [Acidobacteriota bacterium]